VNVDAVLRRRRRTCWRGCLSGPLRLLALAGVVIAPAAGCRGWEGDVVRLRSAADAGAPDGAAEPSLPEDVRGGDPLACPPETPAITLLLADGSLVTFDPEARSSPLSGVVRTNCVTPHPLSQPPPSPSPALAIDRGGNAWILDAAGSLFRVARGTTACVPTGFGVGPAGGWFRMAFVADGAAPARETLYVVVARDRPAGSFPPADSDLSALDLGSGFTLRSTVRLAGWPWIAGTGAQAAGSGELWGLFAPSTTSTISGWSLTVIDPRTGALGPKIVSVTETSGADLSAMVAWRGGFWFFTWANGNVATLMNGSDGVSEPSVPLPSPDGGLPASAPRIVAAAISSCAPAR
jgi:hypothetical protein